MVLPVPNLDDKAFDELVQEARARISRYFPEWTDHNLHDPGITFIELFAWLAEMQIYQLNRVPDAHYQEFLELVDIPPFTVQPAKVGITFENVTEEKIVEAGEQVITEVGAERIVFETEEDATLIPVSLGSIVTAYDSQTIDNSEANKRDDIYFAPFGEKANEGGALLLGIDKPFPEMAIQIAIILFEADLPPAGSHGDEPEDVSPTVSLEWEYLVDGKWETLALEKDTTMALSRSGKILFAGPPGMDEKDDQCWIRCRLKEGRYEIIPQINTILLNTISAVQIETIRNETLGTGHGIPGQVVLLNKVPVIRNSQNIQIRSESGEWEDWEEADDFESSGPADPHYVFNPGKGEITFGNGLNGMMPSGSQEIRAASYQITLGAAGNLRQGQQWRINEEGFEGILGTNLKAATGGKAAESTEHAKSRARKDFRTLYRAVTSDDYEKLALSTPGLRVARAKALPGYHPAYPCIEIPGTITVVVVPYSRGKSVAPLPGDGFLHTVLDHLNRHRLITTNLHVVGPEYVRISVTCNVRVRKKSSPTETKKRVEEALTEFLDPFIGGPDGKGWPFGRAVYPSEIYQTIDKVEGVDYATGVSISVEGQSQEEQGANIIKIPPIGLAISGEHQVNIV